MRLTRFIVDALGVATISLVAILLLISLFCIIYSYYFRRKIQTQNLTQLSYFTGPWAIRIGLIVFTIWWGISEIIRLNLLRHNGRVLDAVNSKWQENLCKCYIVSNLGFAEPCFFITLAFLLRASLQKLSVGPLSQRWSYKTMSYILLYTLPVLILQVMVIIFTPKFHNLRNLPLYFTRTAFIRKDSEISHCTYPLLSIIILGIFATILTCYMFYLGRRILNSVINNGLEKRVYTLIFSVSFFFPLRVLLLGLSVLSKPDLIIFQTFAFLAFCAFFCCAGVGIFTLVYLPISDSLALQSLEKDVEANNRRRFNEEHNETSSLIGNQSPGGDSELSKGGSISFRAMERGETSGTCQEKDLNEGSSGEFVELSLFSKYQQIKSPDSPTLIGWQMKGTVL